MDIFGNGVEQVSPDGCIIVGIAGRSDFGVLGRTISPSLLNEPKLGRPPLRLPNDILPRKRRAVDVSRGRPSLPLSVTEESSLPNVLTGTEELREFKALIKYKRANSGEISKQSCSSCTGCQCCLMAVLPNSRLMLPSFFLTENYHTFSLETSLPEMAFCAWNLITFMRSYIRLQFGFGHLRLPSPTSLLS